MTRAIHLCGTNFFIIENLGLSINLTCIILEGRGENEQAQSQDLNTDPKNREKLVHHAAPFTKTKANNNNQE